MNQFHIDSLHLTVADSDLKSRTIIIGDVHGCYDELLELLKECSYNQNEDSLILVGDLVCKGPKSAEVIKFIYKNKILSVRGNVDEKAFSQYDKIKTHPELNWNDYDWFKQLNNDEINYYHNLPYSVSIPSLNIVVVHAGLMPNIPLEKQNLKDLLYLRNIVRCENSQEYLESFYGAEKGIEWIKLWNGPQHIFFGHDAIRNLQQSEYATGLDTGCCYGGALTACILPSYQFIQVKAKNKYCSFPQIELDRLHKFTEND